MNWEVIERELEMRTSRSSGAGGQHVNKTESRVELLLDVEASQGLSRRERDNIRFHLGNRLDGRGRLSVTDQSDRSQHTNRKRALEDLKRLLERGIRNPPKKRKAGSFKANSRKRLERKKRRGEIKAGRGKIDY
ncbi:ribosome-associated protein [Lewinella marina]|uniref:Aminoacyl-tRNA hydrolase n=1 Tax=Neolewinella marina TaxID=438751 RepID=A0A2G0CF05_9BACT|nr:alternative ribosome rescue aminoacyl-tRNA hydrolase ArfB [Neolewinella marina]NJB85783.1 ribosome-associated protein [Neolewinella marina]PHK98545.1 aminoacyl-tRNA hydrolase [Neolewinella marina]